MLYFLYPQLAKLSGAERLILRLAAHVVRQGMPVTLVTHYFDDTCRPELESRVRLIETGSRAKFFRNHYLDAPLEYLASVRLLSRIDDHPEAMVFFGPPSLPALFWSRQVARHREPHLYFCYEPPRFAYDDSSEVASRLGPAGVFAPPLFAAYKQIDRVMVRRADVLMANSRFGAQRLAAAYGMSSTVITHGVDLPRPDAGKVHDLAERYGLAGKRVLLTVNYLHPRKRIDLYLRACLRVHERMPNMMALVVGSGPEKERLQGLALELGVTEAVRFTGFVPESDLPAHYALADIYMHTGKNESFGLSVLEASAAGIPVVSVDEGGPREIVTQGETGLLVPADAGELASAALELLQDEPRRAAMGAAAQVRAHECYSWERGAAELIQLIKG